MPKSKYLPRGLDVNAPRVCVACNEMKAADAFPFVPGYPHRRKRACRACAAAIKKAKRQANASLSLLERKRLFGDPKPDQFASFWASVNKLGSCWLWTGTLSEKGYGKATAIVLGITYWSAHRISWAIANGDIPSDRHVLHNCDNPWCVNPDHLRLGTNDENVEDKMRADRQVRGERNGRAKLTEDQVRMIRQSDRPDTELANELGVYPSAIRDIRLRRKWQHVN